MTRSTRNFLSPSVALVLALVAAEAHGAGAPMDVLSSADLGDDLGGGPLAIDVLPDGSVVLGGEGSGGGGTLVHLDAAGVPMRATLRLAERIHDVAVDPQTGQVAIATEHALRLFGPDFVPDFQVEIAPDADEMLARRVAVGEHGTIAIAAGRGVHVVSAKGVVLSAAWLEGATITAVAVLDAAGIVVATGWNDRCGAGVETAFLDAFDRRGATRWSAYESCGAGTAQATSSRGRDVTVGGDGNLYVLAEVEGGLDVFAGHESVAFDATTQPPDGALARVAYYARLSARGTHLLGQSFAVPDPDASVTPVALAADVSGAVAITGITTHAFAGEGDGDDVYTEALGAPTGFVQVLSPDFQSRRLWSLMESEGDALVPGALAMGPTHALTLVHRAGHASEGPSVLAWPTEADAAKKRPDRDDVGTFGYESGIAGSDPTCHACGPASTPGPFGAAMLVSFVVMASPRRRSEAHRETHSATAAGDLRR